MKIALLLLPLLAAASPMLKTSISDDIAPLVAHDNAQIIPDSYIISLKKHVSKAHAEKHHSWVQDLHASSQLRRTELRKRSQITIEETAFEGLKHTYNIAGSLMGYSGHFDDETLQSIRNHPDVS